MIPLLRYLFPFQPFPLCERAIYTIRLQRRIPLVPDRQGLPLPLLLTVGDESHATSRTYIVRLDISPHFRSLHQPLLWDLVRRPRQERNQRHQHQHRPK